MPRQRHPVFERGRDARLLRPHSLRGREAEAVRRATVWILNGATKTFTGDTWPGSEHGIHILGLDDFLIFNNNTRPIARQHGAGRHRRRLGRARDQARPRRQDRHPDLVLQGHGDDAYQTDVMGDLQRSRTAPSSSRSAAKGSSRRSPPPEPSCRRRTTDQLRLHPKARDALRSAAPMTARRRRTSRFARSPDARHNRHAASWTRASRPSHR